MEPVYLSYFINGLTPVYGGEKGAFKTVNLKSIDNGDTSNNLQFSFPNHIGTHIDFPRHFNNNGKICIDYPPSFWVFKKIGFLECSIGDVPYKISNLPSDIELLILKTGFGSRRDQEEYWSSQPVIPSDFASLFRNAFPHLRIFGFDLISLTSKLDRAEGKKAHLKFLIEKNILVIEDMDLSCLTCTPEMIIVSPLQVEEADGVPCTIIALNNVYQ